MSGSCVLPQRERQTFDSLPLATLARVAVVVESIQPQNLEFKPLSRYQPIPNYQAGPKETERVAKAIKWVLEAKENKGARGRIAREKRELLNRLLEASDCFEEWKSFSLRLNAIVANVASLTQSSFTVKMADILSDAADSTNKDEAFFGVSHQAASAVRDYVAKEAAEVLVRQGQKAKDIKLVVKRLSGDKNEFVKRVSTLMEQKKPVKVIRAEKEEKEEDVIQEGLNEKLNDVAETILKDISELWRAKSEPKVESLYFTGFNKGTANKHPEFYRYGAATFTKEQLNAFIDNLYILYLSSDLTGQQQLVEQVKEAKQVFENLVAKLNLGEQLVQAYTSSVEKKVITGALDAGDSAAAEFCSSSLVRKAEENTEREVAKKTGIPDDLVDDFASTMVGAYGGESSGVWKNIIMDLCAYYYLLKYDPPKKGTVLLGDLYSLTGEQARGIFDISKDGKQMTVDKSIKVLQAKFTKPFQTVQEALDAVNTPPTVNSNGKLDKLVTTCEAPESMVRRAYAVLAHRVQKVLKSNPSASSNSSTSQSGNSSNQYSFTIAE